MRAVWRRRLLYLDMPGAARVGEDGETSAAIRCHAKIGDPICKSSADETDVCRRRRNALGRPGATVPPRHIQRRTAVARKPRGIEECGISADREPVNAFDT